MILDIFRVFQFDSYYYFERVSMIPHQLPVLRRKHRSLAVLAGFIFLRAAEGSLLKNALNEYATCAIWMTAFYGPFHRDRIIDQIVPADDLPLPFISVTIPAIIFPYLNSEVFDRRIFIPKRQHKLFHRLFLCYHGIEPVGCQRNVRRLHHEIS